MLAQLLAHLWGDYILQSDWMAQNKTKRAWPAAVHAAVYTCCFIPLMWSVRTSIGGYLVIFWTHFLIDRYRLARYVVWAKNWMGPRKQWFRKIGGGTPYWTDQVENGGMFHADGYNAVYAPTPPLWACPTGYPPTTPAWLSTWLLIIADNTLHLTINFFALKYL